MIILQALRYVYSLFKHHGKVKFPFSAVIGRNASFEGCNSIGKNTSFGGQMGRYSYIADNSDIYAVIGSFTSVGSNVQTIMYRHPYTYPWVSTSPVFYSALGQCGGSKFVTENIFQECIMADVERDGAIVIGSDCWINSNVIIISGITIGDGAVVLAGSVVTKDIPPYAVVGGVPAKILKYRYNDDDINFLLQSKWWNRNIDWIRDNWRSFSDMDKFRQLFVNH